MFLLHLAIVCLVALGVSSQGTDLVNNQEKGYPFGKLRLSQDGKTEELIPSTNNVLPPKNQDQPATGSAQPLPSPCLGARPSTKLAYPNEKSKYILCRDEYHYEIFTCPNGGEYNSQTGACPVVTPVLDRCEQEKPCLYDGQCVSLSNSTFKCICKPEWTGERCELPLNSCSKKPCGPGAECRYLKTNELEQDYVCICPAKRGYGLNCQETVPNPCLKSSEQFFPYAFSAHAYIQCDGELIHFQPCGSLLYWNQEEKICDRKRRSKIDMSTLVSKLTTNNNENQQEKGNNEMTTTTTPRPVEQQNMMGQTGQNAAESSSSFASGQVENRPQLTTNLNNQQWSAQGQQQQQGIGASSFVSNSGQAQIGKNNEQQQTFDQQNQRFGSQQWLNSVPSTNLQTNDKIAAPVESWRNLNRQPVAETTGKESNVFRLQGSQTGSAQGEGQSWQTRPSTQFTQPQTWQTSSSSNQNQQIPTMNSVDGKSVDNQNRLNTNLQSNTQFGLGQQSERNQGSSSSKWSSSTSDMKTENNQQFGAQTQPWSNSQTVLSQPQSQDQNQQTFSGALSGTQNINRFPSSQTFNTQEPVTTWQTRPATQLSTNQLPQTTRFNAPPSRTVDGSQQAWQRFDSRSGQSNQQPIVDTGATGSNTIRSQDFQNSNTQEKLQSWQTKGTDSMTENQSFQTRAMGDQPQQNWRRFEAPSAPEQSQNFNQQPRSDTSRTGENNFAGQNLRTIITPQSEQTWQTTPNVQVTESRPVATLNIQRPQQAWRRFEATLPPKKSQEFNQQPRDETTGAFRLQDSQNQNRVESSKPWQTNVFQPRAVEEPQQAWRRFESPTNQQTQNPEVKSRSNQVLAFQPKMWSDKKSTQQENILTSQTPNNQMVVNQPQAGVPSQNSWLPNQQFPTQGGHQLATTNDMTMPSQQNFANRPVQPSATQGLQNWQSGQTS